MTPHPLATWVQLSVSPRRIAVRRRRRLAAALLQRSTESDQNEPGRTLPIPPPRLPVPPSIRRA